MIMTYGVSDYRLIGRLSYESELLPGEFVSLKGESARGTVIGLGDDFLVIMWSTI